MKVARWHHNNDIRIEDDPAPVPGEYEALVKVISCGICGSDVVEWYRLPRAPLVPGHEMGAEVIEVGGSVKKIKPGDRVFIAPKAPCMECFHCKTGRYPACCETTERLPGGFSEYVLVPRSLIEHGTYLLPDAISFDQSVFIEPLACVTRAWRLAGARICSSADLMSCHARPSDAGSPEFGSFDVGPSDIRSVLIIGCGVSGLTHIKLAKTKNIPSFAVDIDRDRLKKAIEFGAEQAFDARQDVSKRLIEKNGKKADLVILCASAVSAVEQAWECVETGGAIVFFTVPEPDQPVTIPINSLWTSEVAILTSYYCGPPDIIEAMRLIETQTINVDEMITHTLPLSETADGFHRVVEGGSALKVIIKPNG